MTTPTHADPGDEPEPDDATEPEPEPESDDDEPGTDDGESDDEPESDDVTEPEPRGEPEPEPEPESDDDEPVTDEPESDDEPESEPDDDELEPDAAAPLAAAPDEIFTVAVGASEPVGGDIADPGPAPTPGPDVGTASGTSVYPDGPPAPAAAPAPAWGTPRLPPPGGQGFERRAPRTGPQPDEHGYYPDDYYLPPNWPALFAKLTITIVLVAAAVAAGLEIADRYATRDEATSADPTPTPVTEVAVYECAGDRDPVALLPPPGSLLIVGRTADSRWLAFRNPEAPPLQLWVEARDVPTFVPETVGVVSCATAPDEFPTPR